MNILCWIFEQDIRIKLYLDFFLNLLFDFFETFIIKLKTLNFLFLIIKLSTMEHLVYWLVGLASIALVITSSIQINSFNKLESNKAQPESAVKMGKQTAVLSLILGLVVTVKFGWSLFSKSEYGQQFDKYSQSIFG